MRPNAQATSYLFQYGTTTAYGSETATASAGSSSAAQTAAATVTGLSPSTTYHFRIVATNGSDTTYGPNATFTTSAAGPAPPSSPPVPELGRSVVVTVASGIVLAKPRGAPRFSRVTGPTLLPVGSLLNTRRGRVKLQHGPESQRKDATGTFWGGTFRVEPDVHPGRE